MGTVNDQNRQTAVKLAVINYWKETDPCYVRH